ncbi:hypothetical protein MHB42_17885 [Lysinibacillus sp. FSL K6-0232]|uniref:hypothetical protein n=1 Tax=unclassified Lysinibacillus TaxID=2636778 RepID=UPI0030F6CA04
MKNPYVYLSNGFAFIFLDLHFFWIPDILPDFLGYLFFIVGIHLLPAFHNLKRWTKNFAIILMVLSFIVEIAQWFGLEIFQGISTQFIQFLFIVFMYYVFQLLLYMYRNEPLEAKTFKAYQIFMICMLGGFVVQAFAINIEASIRDIISFLGSLAQLSAFVVVNYYYRVCYKNIEQEKSIRF